MFLKGNPEWETNSGLNARLRKTTVFASCFPSKGILVSADWKYYTVLWVPPHLKETLAINKGTSSSNYFLPYSSTTSLGTITKSPFCLLMQRTLVCILTIPNPLKNNRTTNTKCNTQQTSVLPSIGDIVTGCSMIFVVEYYKNQEVMTAVLSQDSDKGYWHNTLYNGTCLYGHLITQSLSRIAIAQFLLSLYGIIQLPS